MIKNVFRIKYTDNKDHASELGIIHHPEITEIVNKILLPDEEWLPLGNYSGAGLFGSMYFQNKLGGVEINYRNDFFSSGLHLTADFSSNTKENLQTLITNLKLPYNKDKVSEDFLSKYFEKQWLKILRHCNPSQAKQIDQAFNKLCDIN